MIYYKQVEKITFIKSILSLDFKNKHEINLSYIKLIINMYNFANRLKDSSFEVSKQYKKPGRKKGQRVKSIYDPYKETISHLYSLGLSLQKICNYIGIGTKQSLSSYIKKENIFKL